MDCCLKLVLDRDEYKDFYGCAQCGNIVPKSVVIMNTFNMLIQDAQVSIAEEVCGVHDAIASQVLCYEHSIINGEDFIVYRDITFPPRVLKKEYRDLPIYILPAPSGVTFVASLAYITGKFAHLEEYKAQPPFIFPYIAMDFPLHYRFTQGIKNPLYMINNAIVKRPEKTSHSMMPGRGYMLWNFDTTANARMHEFYVESPDYAYIAALNQPVTLKEFELPMYLANNLLKARKLKFIPQKASDVI